MRLLERDIALASLADYANEARRGEGRLVLVAGEAGVGKTALIERFENDVADATWAWGACDGLYTPRPLGPLFDIAAQLGGKLLAACQAGSPREVLFDTLLGELNSPGALTILVIEDLHWADEATLDLLRFTTRRLRNSPAMLIATYRDDALAVDDPLRVVLGELVSQQATRRISVPTLSLDAVQQLAGADAANAEEVWRLTAGNPFFVTELLASAGESLPASARDAVLARAAALSPNARQVLEAAALIGTRVDVSLLDAIVGYSAIGVDACVASGVLTHDETGLRFRHEIARVAVEDALPRYKRVDLHKAILDALAGSGSDDDARLAHHAEGARDTEATYTYSTRAARRAAVLGSHREAAAQFERALKYADDEPAATRAALLDDLGYEASLVDRWEDVATARLAALELWREVGDRLREGETTRMLSRAMWRLCRGPEATAAAEQAVDILSTLPPSRELAWAYASLANQRTLNGQFDEARQLTTDAAAIARQFGADDILSDALNTLSCIEAATERPWLGLMREAMQVAIEFDLYEQAGRAYANLYGLSCVERDFETAEACFVEGMAYCDARDIATYGSCLQGQRTNQLEQLGRWDEAIAIARHLLSRPAISPVNQLNPMLNLGKLLGRRGDPDARATVTRAAEYADGTAEPEWVSLARLASAEVAWSEDRIADARADIAVAAKVAATFDRWIAADVEVWLSRLGLPAQSSHEGLPMPHARYLAGDFRGSAQAWRELGCPYDAAMALADSAADGDLRNALEQFDELGAVAAARITRAKMRRLGLRAVPAGPQTATRSNRYQLTRRETEILQLLVEGLTNVEIAERLVISTRTVDHHVSSVLRKMGVSSRLTAAREAVRLGVVDEPVTM